MEWYVFLIIIKGLTDDYCEAFKKEMQRLGSRDFGSGPWHIKNEAHYCTNIMTKQDAIDRHFINEDGELLYWGYPGNGNTVFNIFRFANEDDALNFGSMMEDSFIGII